MRTEKERKNNKVNKWKKEGKKREEKGSDHYSMPFLAILGIRVADQTSPIH
jgi:hypothetical protein